MLAIMVPDCDFRMLVGSLDWAACGDVTLIGVILGEALNQALNQLSFQRS